MAKSKAEKWTTPEAVALLDQWNMDGKSDQEIAQTIGISRSTLAEWKKKYPDVGAALECPEVKRQRMKREYWTSEEGMELIAAWYRSGKTDEEVAAEIGVARSTMYEWRLLSPEFSEKVRASKKVADTKVETALYKNATGYAYTEEVAIKIKKTVYDESGRKVEEEEHVEVVKLQKWHGADVPAQIFWLKNRDQENWRDKREYEVKTPPVKIEFLDKDDERWGE